MEKTGKDRLDELGCYLFGNYQQGYEKQGGIK